MSNTVDRHKPRHTDEELKLIRRRTAENWLLQNSGWIERLRKDTRSSTLKGRRSFTWIRKRLDKGVEYGVLKMTGMHSGSRWKLTPYAERLLMEMEE